MSLKCGLKRSAPDLSGSAEQRGAARRRLDLVNWSPHPIYRLESKSSFQDQRILLFVSHKKGCIGKLIYSRVPGKQNQAHIDSVWIHESERGHGLGNLLIHQCMVALEAVGIQSVQLEAEENESRFGRLVKYYEQEGFAERPSASIKFLYNQEETLRRVPMHVDDVKATRQRLCRANALDHSDRFLPVQLGTRCDSAGLTLQSSSEGELSLALASAGTGGDKGCREWKLIEFDDDTVCFEGPYGNYLSVRPSGDVTGNSDLLGPDSSFHLEDYHASAALTADANTDIDAGTSANQGESAEAAERPNEDSLQRHTGKGAEAEAVCALRTAHGLYLCVKDSQISAGETPSPWVLGRDRCLWWERPRSHEHRWQMHRLQSEPWVTEQRDRRIEVLRAGHRSATLYEVIKRLMSFDNPVRCSAGGISTGHFLLIAAETARAAGHPDWIQLAALMHACGEILYLLRHDTAGTDDGTAALSDHTASLADAKDSEEWALAESRWVLGFDHPDRPAPGLCSEMEMYMESQYEADCGLSNVTLSWSKHEYLYHMLTENHTTLPWEALAAVRFQPLIAWHRNRDWQGQPAQSHSSNGSGSGNPSASSPKSVETGFFDVIMDEKDREAFFWVKLLDQTINEAKQSARTLNSKDWPDLDSVWPYYRELAVKYLSDSALVW